MRLTCLKCGHQIELAVGPSTATVSCPCGQDYTYPEVLNTGIRPNERAAERSRSRAFRAAGLVKNIGGFAFGLALLSLVFFPLGIAAAAMGLYVLTMLRGPVSRYSGRRSAVAAVALGTLVFAGGALLTLSWYESRHLQQLKSLQASASEDLRALLRAQRLFRASTDTYGSFREFSFKPQYGHYTIYMANDDYLTGMRGGRSRQDPLPDGLAPGFTDNTFTAVAVGNLDDDDDLDVWVLNDSGRITHVRDDLAE